MQDSFFTTRGGLATIPTIIALTLLILAIGLGITLSSFNEALESAGSYQASQAQLYAEAGARDALIRIARNKTYTCASADCYSIDMATSGCVSNDGCARVTVSIGTGASGDPKIITSKGQVKTNVRRVQVDVLLDASSSGQIVTSTWQDLNN